MSYCVVAVVDAVGSETVVAVDGSGSLKNGKRVEKAAAGVADGVALGKRYDVGFVEIVPDGETAKSGERGLVYEVAGREIGDGSGHDRS